MAPCSPVCNRYWIFLGIGSLPCMVAWVVVQFPHLPHHLKLLPFIFFSCGSPCLGGTNLHLAIVLCLLTLASSPVALTFGQSLAKWPVLPQLKHFFSFRFLALPPLPPLLLFMLCTRLSTWPAVTLIADAGACRSLGNLAGSQRLRCFNSLNSFTAEAQTSLYDKFFLQNASRLSNVSRKPFLVRDR